MLAPVERELRRAVVSGGVWAVGGRVLSALAALAVTALVTRRATAADAAAYFLAVSIIVVAGGLAQRGVNFTVIRMAAQALANGHPGRARGAIAAALRFTFLGALLFALVASAAAPFALPARLLAALCIVLFTLQLVSSEALRGLHAISAATLAGTVLAPVVALAGVAVAEATLTQILVAVAVSHAVAAAAGLLMLHARTRRLGPSERMPLSALTSAAMPAWISGIGMLLFVHVDLWIAAGFLPATDVAAYGAASRLSTILMVPLILVNSVIAPIIVDLYTRGELQQLQLVLRGTAALAAIPALSVVLVFALFGRTILETAFGPGYGAAAVLVLLLGAGQTANVLTGSCGITLLMTGNERLLMRIVAIALPVTALAGVIAARTWGVTGIAAAFALGLAVLNVVLLISVRRTTGLRTHAGLGAMLALIRGERRAA